jgi:hypothetical protein
MATTQQPLIGADAVYRSGLEKLVSQSSTILAGRVSQYSKQVLSESEPGPNAIPLKWVVTGRIDHPKVLKGVNIPQPVAFSRAEQSVIIPRDPSIPEWELQYSELAPDKNAVLFFQGDPAAPTVKVLPSGADTPDLISLVADVVRIQALGKGAQQEAWLAYLRNAERVDGVEVASRSLLASEIPWNKLAPSVSQLMRNPSAPAPARAFVFGAVTFWLTQGNWRGDTRLVVDFLCQAFAAERNDDLALEFVLHLKQILRYADMEKFRKERQPIREQVLHCLRGTTAQGPGVDQQYRDIFSRYPH